MPVTRKHEETLRVAGTCAGWFRKCIAALEKGRFGFIRADDESFIVDADCKGFTINGDIRLLLTQERDQVAIEIRISAAVDNIWALRDPLQRILVAFKENLD
jgi:hypothetical protein